MVALFALAYGIAHAEGPPTLTAELAQGTVTVKFPVSSFEVGDQKPFKVLVEPAPGNAPPAAVRGRFGMPYMGHWVTEEQSQAFAQGGMEFMSNIEMYGVYRFRIWLDYADQPAAKTAFDFKVMANQPLDAEVVNE